MKNIVVRSLSGVVYVALIVCSIMFGGIWCFPSVCVLFAILAVSEYHRLCNGGGGSLALTALDMLGATVIVASPSAFMVAASSPYSSNLILIAASALSACIVYLIARMIAQLYVTGINPVASMLTGLSAQMYIALPLSCASLMYLVCNPQIVLAMFILIWLNDTGAFCVGSLIGKHRLFERVSPKKSWEGFFGGLAFAVGGAAIIKAVFGSWAPGLTMAQMCVMGAVVSVFATWGDLAESLIKRTVHVKDSGHIMPGHGGILDRIDSLLLVAPAMICFITILYIF